MRFFNPEGMAVDIAFAGLSTNSDVSVLVAAIMLAVGIGIQNFPEGLATSLSLRREGMPRGKALFYGQASGIVEPISGVLGCIFAIQCASITTNTIKFCIRSNDSNMCIRINT